MAWTVDWVSTEPADVGESVWKEPGFVLPALGAFTTKRTKQHRSARGSLCPLHTKSYTMTTCKTLCGSISFLLRHAQSMCGIHFLLLAPFLLLDKEKESEFREEMRNVNQEDCLRSL